MQAIATEMYAYLMEEWRLAKARASSGQPEAALDGRKVSTYTQLRVELDRPIQLLNRLADRLILGQSAQ